MKITYEVMLDRVTSGWWSFRERKTKKTQVEVTATVYDFYSNDMYVDIESVQSKGQSIPLETIDDNTMDKLCDAGINHVYALYGLL